MLAGSTVLPRAYVVWGDCEVGEIFPAVIATSRRTALPTVSRWTSLLRTAAPLRFSRASVYTVLPLDGALLPVLSYSWEVPLSLWNGLW